MTLKGKFTFNFQFSLFRTAFQRLGYIFIVELFIEHSCCMMSPAEIRCAEADRKNRDLQNVADPRKDCGSFVDEKLRALHHRNLNK